MDFANDIFTLEPPSKTSFKLEGTSLPTNKDLYFRTKQREIIDQYAAARIFLRVKLMIGRIGLIRLMMKEIILPSKKYLQHIFMKQR